MTTRLDEDLTPITCSNCGSRFTYGTGEDAGQCPICRGRALRPSQWKRSQERALTAAGFANVIRDLSAQLEDRSGPTEARLLEEGRAMLAMFESWGASAPEERARSQAIDELATWHRRVIQLLHGG